LLIDFNRTDYYRIAAKRQSTYAIFTLY